MAEQRKRTTRRAVESAVAVAKNDCVDAEVLVVRAENGTVRWAYDGAGDALGAIGSVIDLIDDWKGTGGVRYGCSFARGEVPTPDDSEDDDEDEED